MKRLIPAAVTAALLAPAPADAREVNGVKVIEDCKDRDRPAFCRDRRHRLLRIAPYIGSFLAPVGACESGTTGNLRYGLRATSPSGQYLGRYQFGSPDWYRAGGRGDPRDASWLEQGYRAVVWLRVNGRGSWPNC